MHEATLVSKLKAILESNLDLTLRRLMPDGHYEGDEYVACSPLRADKNPGSFKFNVPARKWYDFATKESGDVLDLYCAVHQVDVRGAAKMLEVGGGVPEAREKVRRIHGGEDWSLIYPAPNVPEVAELRHSKHGTPNHLYVYRDALCRPLMLVVRFDLADGSKEIFPLTFRKNGVEMQWRWKGWGGRDRPIYGLDRLAAFPQDVPVIVVEGEKTANALQDAVGHGSAVVLTWHGGTHAAKLTDWSPVVDRNVIIWPDADDPGLAAARDIFGILARKNDVRIALPPEDVKKGWDAADAILNDGWTAERISAFLTTSTAHNPDQNSNEADQPEAKRKSTGTRSVPPPPPTKPAVTHAATAWLTNNPHFRTLGHFDGRFWFYIKRGRRVAAYMSRDLVEAQLVELANPADWALHFGSPESGKIQWREIRAALVWLAYDLPFNPARLRGRGAWEDEGRIVVNTGEFLFFDDEPVSYGDNPSRFIYMPSSTTLDLPDEAASASEGRQVLRLFSMLNFEKPESSKCLAGWLFLAPVCGALRWRPHVWLTGPAGCGKSTVVNDFMSPFIEGVGIVAHGSTTEAGLRQTVKTDAVPVVFDEAEGSDKSSAERLQKILELARIASSGGGAKVLKGSVGGASQEFQISSSFAFASISPTAKLYQDETRITLLEMQVDRAEGASERYAKLQSDRHSILTAEAIARIRARAVRLIPQIRECAETFAVAAATKLGESRRQGDQIGTLLAGAWMLASDMPATPEQARSALEQYAFEEEAQLAEATSEERCFRHLLSSEITVTTADNRSIRARVGIVAQIAMGKPDDVLSISMAEADKALQSHGLRVTANHGGPKARHELHIAHNHNWVDATFGRSEWGSGWRSVLRRLPDGHSGKMLRIAGQLSRTTIVGLANCGMLAAET